MLSTEGSTGAGEVVDIDTNTLPSSVAETTTTAASAALNTGQATLGAATTAGAGADALTAAMNATVTAWSAHSAGIGADLAAGGTHLGERTAATTTGLTETDHGGGSGIDAIGHSGPTYTI